MDAPTITNYNPPIQPVKVSQIVIFLGYLFAIGGSVIGVIIGHTIKTKQIKLPDNTMAYKYIASDRKHGKSISNIATTMFTLGLILSLLL
jgi:hypothetical protein